MFFFGHHHHQQNLVLTLESWVLSLDIWALLRDIWALLRDLWEDLWEGRFLLRRLRSAGLQAGREGHLVKLGAALVGGIHEIIFFFTRFIIRRT